MDQVNRKYLRIPPSPQKPVTVVFREEGLERLASRTKVVDISIGGLGLEITEAESLLKAGMRLERIELTIPEEGVCTLPGTIAFLSGSKCGIEFNHEAEGEFTKIARYIYRREIELLTLREIRRVSPSPEKPVKVTLRIGGLTYRSSGIRVIDLGTGGLRLEIPGADVETKAGTRIDVIDLALPDEDPCVLSGMVSSLCGKEWDITFDQSRKTELFKMRRYIDRREIELEEVGHGSETMADEARAEAADGSLKEKKKILIVDDSPSIQDEYSRFFFERGFVVLQAKNGAEGIKEALSALPDLILMDVNMPLLSGLESTRIITNHPNTKDIPILMFTTEGEKGAVVKAIEAGAKDYIIKTMDKRFVLERVERFLEG